MSLEFKVASFEGPLDLLLTLIEKNKVDIYDIPIAKITDQYMAYVEEMREENLDTLSDFLVMASTLLEIKARMLLPKEEDENGEEIDPRTELVERLIEYQQIKKLAEELGVVYEDAEMHFYKESTVPSEVRQYREIPKVSELLKDYSVFDLQDIFTMVMERKQEMMDPIRSSFGSIRTDPVRISDKLSFLLDYGREKQQFSFRQLLENQKTKMDVVVTFLACLELIKVGQLFVEQKANFQEIDLKWNDHCEQQISKEDIKQYD